MTHMYRSGRILCPFCTGLLFLGAVTVLSHKSVSLAADGETPSWQSGVSNWNGSGYDLPSVPSLTPSSDPGAAVSTPYTVPVDPSAQLPSTEAYGLPETDSLELSSPTGTVERMLLPPLGEETPTLTDSLTGASSSDQIVPSAELPVAPSVGTDVGELESAGAVAPLGADDYAPLPVPDPEINESSDGAVIEGIAEEVNAGDAVEPAPLQSEVIRWYQYPQRWMRGWDSHAEFGLDGSDGNANTLAIQTGMELKRKTDVYTLGIDVNYRQASSRNKTTEENGRFNIDYDRLIADSSWSAFGKYGMEWDRFKAFDLRINLNGGLGYYWVRTDDATLATRFGAGASREIGAPIDDWIPEAVFGLEAERQLTARQKLKGKIDYFPAWENFGDYRLVSDVAWEILLDGSENLSLKLAATDRYDSTPQGARPNDVYYSLLLLYKF